ncbi:SDR family oxidoreductase [Actinotalea subterranea]|uniref:SDR family oxidoreductase n=1 Tax=Actinotalea subterranea TaxID=2607497 RepID=UPI0011EE9C83|nr:SDR family oxidoreductase [Actinotalea subterranea]
MVDQHTPQDPTQQHPEPEQPAQTIDHPGVTSDMAQEPDHGEDTYVGSGKLEGKRAVITGGDSGIGRAVAIAFAREGADVLLTYLPEEEEDARVTVGHVEAAGRRAIAVPGDLRDEAHCHAVVDRAVAELGGIDVLVNNAAYQMAQEDGIFGITTEQLDRVMKTNVYAMFWLTKAALAHMRPGATIINTASIQGYQPSPQLLDYAMTKAAILSFTKALAQQLAEQGIRVNAVAPGPIWTPLIPATMPGEKVKQFGGDTPMGRAGQPAELAPAYVFFASQESSYITGERLGVTGGKPLP